MKAKGKDSPQKVREGYDLGRTKSVPGVLPSSLEAEIAVLGSALLDQEAAEKVFLSVKLEEFCENSHKILFKAMCFVFQREGKCDLILLSDALGDALSEVGGLQYLEQIVESVASPAMVDRHIRTLKEKSRLRDLIRVGESLVDRARRQEGSSLEIASDASVEIDRSVSDIQPDVLQTSDLVTQYMDELSDRLTRSKRGTGFPDIDVHLTEGFAAGRLSIIGGRPRVGKSALTTSVIVSLLRRGHSVFFATLEMDAVSQVDRIVSSLTGIPLRCLLGNEPLIPYQLRRIFEIMEKIERWKLVTYEGEVPTVMWLVRLARAWHIRTPFDVVVIDLLDYIDEMQQHQGQAQVIEKWIKRLRKIAKQMGWHILLVAQLSRATEKDSKEYVPRLEHFKGSGGFEQTADLVFLLYRPRVYDSDSGEEDVCFVHCAKQRQGEQFTARLIYNGPCVQFLPWRPLKGSVQSEGGVYRGRYSSAGLRVP